MRLCRERVDITSVLKNILDNYPAGGAVLRELLQNSDDAGATSQTFILDQRTHSKVELPHNALVECQGPALLAINDSTFKLKDWEAITNIHNSSKSADETQTGKYGLGFRSCYHLTDNPQVFSTTSLLILDPHDEFGEYAGGLQLESSDGDVTKYPNLYEPFDIPDIIPDLKNYKGTAIRLPLRSAGQAKRSRIKTGSDAEVTTARVEEWFDHFVETELSIAMLFLKHVSKIELRIISDNNESITVASSSIVPAPGDGVEGNRSLNRGRVSEKSRHTLMIETSAKGGASNRTQWMVTQFVRDNDEMERELCQVLERPQPEVAEQMKKDKLLPHLALALPLTPVQDGLRTGPQGRLFSLLPLPIVTNFPLHIHAVFALLSSRQNLQNSQENVGRDSRERLLIEWNRLIFNSVLPKAWSYLLQELPLVNAQIGVYSAWPTIANAGQGDAGYWADLPANLLEQAAAHPVWPEHGSGEHLILNNALVASSDQPEDLLSALQVVGLPITRPPQHIFDLISKSSFHNRILSPASACLALESHLPALRNLTANQIDIIAEYIASAGQISLFNVIPLVRAVSGDFVTVDPSLAILASQQEADLFKEMNPNMLARDKMLPITMALMDGSIDRLDVPTVVQYLKHFSANNSPQEDVGEEAVAWLCQFWTYISSWTKGLKLLNQIRECHVIPTWDGALRCASTRILDPAEDCDPELLKALKGFSIPLLHPNMTKTSRTFLRKCGVVAVDHDMGFLLDVIKCKSSSNAPSTMRKQRRTLHNYLKLQLPSYRVQLDKRQISKLLKLPVFPILSVGKKGSGDAVSNLGPVGSTYYFVDSSVSVIPDLKGTTFIDTKECPELLRAARRMDDVKNEMDILRLVLQHQEQWPQQPQPVSERLLERFFNRFSDLSPRLRDQLHELPFVDVGGGRLRPPCETIDPESRIATLFTPSDQVFPVGRFDERGPDTILTQLRTRGFLQTKLSTSIIHERLQNMDRAHILELLKVVDDHYLSHTLVLDNFLPPPFFSTLWVPASERLHFIHECRDLQGPSNLLLYDLVLPVVDYSVKSVELRTALGWGMIQTETIIEQMTKAIPDHNTSEDKTRHRITSLINELADRLSTQVCSMSDLEGLQVFLKGRSWIPMPDAELEIAERCTVQSVDLGPLSRLKQLPHTLRGNPKVVTFLEHFGVCQRPSVAALLSELEYLRQDDQTPPSALAAVIRSYMATLAELSIREQLRPEERAAIWLPIAVGVHGSGLFRPIVQVCYDNMQGGNGPPPAMFFAHPAISPELADTLRLERVSDLEYEMAREGEFEPSDDDEPEPSDSGGSEACDRGDFESFDIREELTTRIQNVLKAYSEDSSSNEWVANAHDAGASKVSLICSEQEFNIGRSPSPQLAKYFEGPSLIVHNSATFSKEDFAGLQKVGLGGKLEKPDSIGRFGLGVLSFYHFGDVMMLVSGHSVVFLDPSRRALPRKRGGGKRSGMKMSIRACRTHFPDFFLAIDAVEGFNAREDRYEGTIFVVPLRSEAQAKTSKLSTASVSSPSVVGRFRRAFKANAKNSLFFTRLSTISATHRLSSGATEPMWIIGAIRGEEKEKGGMKHQRIKLTGNTELDDSEWLLTSRADSLPSIFGPLASKNKLPPMITAAVVVQISPPPATQPFYPPVVKATHWLFATLPLPIVTKLNAHIHSPFILSDSRRHLHFESSGPRDPGSDIAFNEWLLSDMIPPLLLHAIALLNVEDDGRAVAHSLWPDQFCFTTPSSFDTLLAKSLYRMVPGSQEELFETPSGTKVSPSNVILGISGAQSVGALLGGLYPKNFAPCPFSWSLLLSSLSPPNPSASQHNDIDSSPPGSPTSSASIETDSANVVRSALQSNRTDLLAGSLLDSTNLDDLVWYLLKGGESLTGLPLLRLEAGELVCFAEFSNSDTPVFPYNHAIASLFGESQVAIQQGPHSLLDTTIDAIVKKGLNLTRLDLAGLRMLITRSKWFVESHSAQSPETEAALRWIREFWETCLAGNLGIKAGPDDFMDIPLFPTVNGPSISLSSCRDQVTFWREQESWDDEAKQVLRTLCKLGLRVIDMEYSQFEWEIRGNYPKLSSTLGIALVLEFLSTREGIGSTEKILKRVSRESWNDLAAWIRNNHMPAVERFFATRPNIASLPLWEAQQISPDAGPPGLRSLEEVFMLPKGASSSLMAKFMDGQGTWFCENSTRYSYALQNMLPDNRVLDPKRLLRRLEVVPQTLATEETPDFLDFLRMLKALGAPAPSQPFIPNGDLELCSPQDVYHIGTPLFALAFQNQRDRLLSQDFVELGDWLGTLGVPKEVTSRSFLTAVEAIHQFTQDGEEVTTDGPGLEVAFATLNEDPWMFTPPSRKEVYGKIRKLRFIHRRVERRSDLAQLEALARPRLGKVLAMDKLVREEYHLCAWTQRALFAVEPSDDLRAVFPGIGVPDAKEVVAHLETLTDAIRNKSDLGRHLKDDIKATYTWLNEHSEDAREPLQKRKDKLLFWNVNECDDNMGKETWNSSTMMWLNVRRDDKDNRRYSVKSFLGQFGALLKAAGVREFPIQEYEGATSSRADYFERIHSSLNSFRAPQEKLADVIFYPRDGRASKAHRSVLAASSSYFENLFTGEWREATLSASPSKPVEIQVPDYSYEEVESALHHVYTANFKPPHAPTADETDTAGQDSTESCGDKLDALINLLHLSNRWSLDELKLDTGEFIRDSNFIIPSKLQHLISECERAQAHDLLQHCRAIRDSAGKQGWRFGET